jgi:hypothetical protein
MADSQQGDEIIDGHKIELDCYRTIDIGLLEFGSRKFHDLFLYSNSDKPPQRCTDGEYALSFSFAYAYLK